MVNEIKKCFENIGEYTGYSLILQYTTMIT